MQDQPKPADHVLAFVRSGQELADWIARRQNDLEVSGGRTKHVPAVILGLAIEHQMGIVELIARQHFGSAFALVRPQFEALVRGIWFDRCASPEEVLALYKEDRLPQRDGRDIRFKRMIEDIERHPEYADNVFSQVVRHAWPTMNSLTHGGMQQVWRRINGETIEPVYPDEELIEVLRAAGTFALLALLHAAYMADSEELVNAVQAKLNEASAV